jgi:hypothetical protein
MLAVAVAVTCETLDAPQPVCPEPDVRRGRSTIIVSVKINDGIVMAADSAGAMPSGQVYAHANKIANLCEGLPIGAMSTGAGGIGNESVETLLKDLRRRFAGLDPAHPDWRLDPAGYAMEHVAGRLRSFLFEEKAAPFPEPTNLQLRLCGYSAGRPLAEVWEVSMTGRDCPPPRRIMDENGFGVLWDGNTRRSIADRRHHQARGLPLGAEQAPPSRRLPPRRLTPARGGRARREAAGERPPVA